MRLPGGVRKELQEMLSPKHFPGADKKTQAADVEQTQHYPLRRQKEGGDAEHFPHVSGTPRVI